MSSDASRSRSSTIPPVMLLDACAVINLYASGYMREILRSASGSFAIVDRVYQEALYIRRGGTGDEINLRDPIDLKEMLSLGLLTIAAGASEEELNTFIDLTLYLGDGEAMTAALALHRRQAMVTDDRVALRVLANRIPTLASLELFKYWADHDSPSPLTLKTALWNLRERGSYLPGRTHPLRSWWDRCLAAE